MVKTLAKFVITAATAIVSGVVLSITNEAKRRNEGIKAVIKEQNKSGHKEEQK